MKSKLKLFEINNLFNQFNVRLPLDEKVNIFLGENGMGKTTILNCLYYVLSGNIEKLNNIIFDAISLTFIDGEKISINHNDISSYVEDYIYDNSPYRRRRVRFESLFSIKELENIKSIPTSFLDTGGLKVYTTLDLNAQKSLEDSVSKNLKGKSLQTAAITMNPENGEILGLIGGVDYSKSGFNRATNSIRQVGSTMKTFLYYAALENGFTPSTAFTSEQTTFTFSNKQSYSPKNANEVYGNIPISLATAISYSDNIYAVKTHMFLGEDTLVNMAKRLGITAKLSANPSLPLGTNEINIIEMTSAYATFANEGYKVTPHLIKKVEDQNGNVLYEYKEEKEMILNSSLTYILNELLTTTYDKSFIDYNYPTILSLAAKMSRKYAVKSGTTATDLWTIGYTPQAITSVWVGYDENKEISSKEYQCAKNIWIDTMEAYLKDKEKTWYTKPNNVVGYLVDPISGKPANEESKHKKILYYLKGTEPTGNEMVFDEIKNQE